MSIDAFMYDFGILHRQGQNKLSTVVVAAGNMPSEMRGGGEEKNVIFFPFASLKVFSLSTFLNFRYFCLYLSLMMLT